MIYEKEDLARRQLGTALSLFIEDRDPVSVHILACAGCEIAEHLTQKAGAKPFSTHILATFPSVNVKAIRNQYWNAFKHATTQRGIERDDRELLSRFSDVVNDHMLFLGWYDYMLATLATRVLPVEAQVFQVWYFALNSERLKPEVDQTSFNIVFPNLCMQSRPEQKARLREVIARYRDDQELLNNPATDPRPLILSNWP